MACIELQIKLIFPVYYNVSFYIEGGESPEQRLSCTGLLRKAQLKDHLVNLRQEKYQENSCQVNVDLIFLSPSTRSTLTNIVYFADHTQSVQNVSDPLSVTSKPFKKLSGLFQAYWYELLIDSNSQRPESRTIYILAQIRNNSDIRLHYQSAECLNYIMQHYDEFQMKARDSTTSQ